ncbi:hypothetical protein HBI56_172020 [Parastagonospora nodorum]|uniref:Uncharacterized protein n=1 Tax=Phaeosphaeria nodorum (strain SN15 / ATCC MYA-4574 / FGSC 10173) TaxID=321614 RepID=A0A7U2F1R9_PHANO|nr:hypothetical protein HBH56_220750 [Parastagonospora nodorum]QRC97119.1 hypothetical protein JI435_140020 [Parastagonospora nodorum SN15]KAH3924069.1 hypothetical protein HBH54_200980 [Parastagonospora nodorum]KAH3944498.1 hypothetical protein HBH53_157350 [Parastagonospora nodorum]KAH4046235.1 hypothetical protein HBH49_187380 [Parastagonospora nodorum]
MQEFRLAAAKSECLDLARRFYHAVPREVRDMVYSYLCQPRLSEESRIKFHELHCGDGQLPDIPHWQRKDMVGPEFAREYTEFFYETTDMRMSFRAISYALAFDPFGSGIVPSDFIRSCTIVFRIAYDTADSGKDERTTVRGQLRALTRLKQRSGTITFEIELDSKEYVIRQFAYLFRQLVFLGPIVFELKDQAFHCNVAIVSDMRKSTQARIDVTSLWSEPKGALISKLHNWHVFCPQRRGYDAAFLDMELTTLTIPNHEDILIRGELGVSENDADHSILKRMLRITMGEGD